MSDKNPVTFQTIIDENINDETNHLAVSFRLNGEHDFWFEVEGELAETVKDYYKDRKAEDFVVLLLSYMIDKGSLYFLRARQGNITATVSVY